MYLSRDGRASLDHYGWRQEEKHGSDGEDTGPARQGKGRVCGQPKKGGKAKTVAEKRSRGLQAPDMNDPKFLGEVGKMSAITPYSLASQFNVKLSVAKDLLEELERRKLVTLVGGNARIRIYQPAAA